MSTFPYTWVALTPGAPAQNGGVDVEPFSAWKRLRGDSLGSEELLIQLPEGSSDAEATFLAFGRKPPPVYPATRSRFWTLRRARPEPPPTGVAWPPPWLNRVKAIGGDDVMFRAPPASAPSAPATPSPGASSTALDPVLQPVAAPVGPTEPPVIAVIDTSIAYLHKQFRKRVDVAHTRILALWDQDESQPADKPWRTVDHFDYGRELRQEDINELIALTRSGESERSVYARVAALPMSPWSHGTHVLAIAAGAKDPMVPDRSSGDRAADLDIIAVQLPRRAVAQTHGVWLNTYLLDGIHYALQRAPATAPVVVNISMGGSLGPHDGTSLLEAAIDDLVQAWGGRLTVVLAAGNARDSRMHVEARPDRIRPVTFAVSTVADDCTPNFVDMWIPGTAGATLDLGVELANGAGPLAAPLALRPGDASALYRTTDNGAEPVALACLSRAGRAPNGSGTQAFVGIAPVKGVMSGPPAPAGEWAITLGTTSRNPVNVDVWLGRDDIPAGEEGGPQPQLQFDRGPPPVPQGTLSSVAGGNEAICVGAYRALSGQVPQMYEHSGEGGGRFRAPDLCGATAVGDGPGAPDVWFCSDAPPPEGIERNAQEGTSFAAPFVARRIANLLARNAGAWMRKADVLAALRASGDLPQPPGQPGWTSPFWLRP